MINNLIFLKNIYFKNLTYRKLQSNTYEFAVFECISFNFNCLYCIEENNINTYYGSCIENDNLVVNKLKNCYTVVINNDIVKTILKILFKKKNILFIYGKSEYLKNYSDEMKKILDNDKFFIIYETCFNKKIINYENFNFDIVISNIIFNFEYTLNSICDSIKFNKIIISNIHYFLIGDYISIIENYENNIILCNNDNKNYNFIISNQENLINFKNREPYLDTNINLLKIKL